MATHLNLTHGEITDGRDEAEKKQLGNNIYQTIYFFKLIGTKPKSRNAIYDDLSMYLLTIQKNNHQGVKTRIWISTWGN